MAVIVGYFYQGQDERLTDEATVVGAVDGVTDWLLDGGWRNLVVEIANECDVPNYEHQIIGPFRVRELIERVQSHTRDGRRLLASTSFRGGSLPYEDVLRVADLVLLHGNGVTDPTIMSWMIERTRMRLRGRQVPIVVNEDDHFAFDQPSNNFLAAVSSYASWGLFDAGPAGWRWCSQQLPRRVSACAGQLVDEHADEAGLLPAGPRDHRRRLSVNRTRPQRFGVCQAPMSF